MPRETLLQRVKRWIDRKTENALDHAALTLTGRCRHKTHQEMLAARSHCPFCRRRYVAWAESVGLTTFELDRSHAPSEWIGGDSRGREIF